MQSSMSWPPAVPSGPFPRLGPSHPKPRATRQSSKTVGHFDADELTHRLQQILSDQRAHEERQRRHHHHNKTDEPRRQPQLPQQQQQQQQQQQGPPHHQQRYTPREAARQFSRTATSASTLHALHGRPAEQSTPAMRFNQGLPVVAAPTHVRSQSQTTYTQFQFPFSSASPSHPQSTVPVSSTDSTPPPAPAPAALKQWSRNDSAATTMVGHMSTPPPAPAAAAARGSKGPAAAVWTPLLKRADSLWGLRRSRTGSKGSLRVVVEGGGKGKGKKGGGVAEWAVGEGEEGGKWGKGFFGKFR